MRQKEPQQKYGVNKVLAKESYHECMNTESKSTQKRGYESPPSELQSPVFASIRNFISVLNSSKVMVMGFEPEGGFESDVFSGPPREFRSRLEMVSKDSLAGPALDWLRGPTPSSMVLSCAKFNEAERLDSSGRPVGADRASVVKFRLAKCWAKFCCDKSCAKLACSGLRPNVLN